MSARAKMKRKDFHISESEETDYLRGESTDWPRREGENSSY